MISNVQTALGLLMCTNIPAIKSTLKEAINFRVPTYLFPDL